MKKNESNFILQTLTMTKITGHAAQRTSEIQTTYTYLLASYMTMSFNALFVFLQSLHFEFSI